MQTPSIFPTRPRVIDLPPRACQFHGGNKSEDGFLVFCGKPLKPGYSYCAAHHAKVFQRVPAGRAQRVVTEVVPEPTEVALPDLEQEAA